VSRDFGVALPLVDARTAPPPPSASSRTVYSWSLSSPVSVSGLAGPVAVPVAAFGAVAVALNCEACGESV
jgi:hypothetical protein